MTQSKPNLACMLNVYRGDGLRQVVGGILKRSEVIRNQSQPNLAHTQHVEVMFTTSYRVYLEDGRVRPLPGTPK